MRFISKFIFRQEKSLNVLALNKPLINFSLAQANVMSDKVKSNINIGIAVNQNTFINNVLSYKLSEIRVPFKLKYNDTFLSDIF